MYVYEETYYFCEDMENSWMHEYRNIGLKIEASYLGNELKLFVTSLCCDAWAIANSNEEKRCIVYDKIDDVKNSAKLKHNIAIMNDFYCKRLRKVIKIYYWRR